MRSSYAAALLTLAVGTTASAASLTELGSANLSGFTGGSYVAAEGRYAYVSNSALAVVDVSNPAAPVEVGRLAQSVGAIAVRGRYVYTASALVIDVADPTAPVVVGRWNGGGGWRVTVAGNLVYVAESTALTIVDVSNPTAPIVVGSVALPSQALDVAISEPASTACSTDTFAYLASYDGKLRLVNVTNPAAARIVGELDLAWGEGHGVATSGSYVYATSWPRDDQGDAMTGKLHVVDVSNPAAPRLVTSKPQKKASSHLVLSGGYAYIDEQAVGMNKTYCDTAVVDVRDPAAPVEVARNATTRAIDVAVSGSYVFVPQAQYQKNFIVYQAYAPATPGGL